MDTWEAYRNENPVIQANASKADGMWQELCDVGFVEKQSNANLADELVWTDYAKQFQGQVGQRIEAYAEKRGHQEIADALSTLKNGTFSPPHRTTVGHWVKGESEVLVGNLIQLALILKKDIREFFTIGGSVIPLEQWNASAIKEAVLPLVFSRRVAQEVGNVIWERVRQGGSGTEATNWAHELTVKAVSGYVADPQPVAHVTESLESLNDIRFAEGDMVWFYHVDGWHNLAWHIPSWCFSFAVYRYQKGRLVPVCAVVSAPALNELFYTLAKGAPVLETTVVSAEPKSAKQPPTLLESTDLKLIDGKVSMRDCVVATHFSVTHDEVSKRYLDSGLAMGLLRVCQRVEAIGSGVLAMCYVAAGRYCAFLNPVSNPNSIRAGRIILEAAGHGQPGQGVAVSLPVANAPSSVGVLAASSTRILEELWDIGTILDAWPVAKLPESAECKEILDGLQPLNETSADSNAEILSLLQHLLHRLE